MKMIIAEKIREIKELKVKESMSRDEATKVGKFSIVCVLFVQSPYTFLAQHFHRVQSGRIDHQEQSRVLKCMSLPPEEYRMDSTTEAYKNGLQKFLINKKLFTAKSIEEARDELIEAEKELLHFEDKISMELKF